jgi:hypothetical protein
MLDTDLSRAGLLDRGRERDVLDRLVAGVRAGQSRVLVLRGVVGVLEVAAGGPGAPQRGDRGAVLRRQNPWHAARRPGHELRLQLGDDGCPVTLRALRSPAAARQLASRARRRVQGVAPEPGTDLTRQRAITDAFLTAARNGDFDALIEALDPDVVVRSNGTEAGRGYRGSAELVVTDNTHTEPGVLPMARGASDAINMHADPAIRRGRHAGSCRLPITLCGRGRPAMPDSSRSAGTSDLARAQIA